MNDESPASPVDRGLAGAKTLGDRVGAHRERLFVGREAERELFAMALNAPAPPFSVLFVHGPGGIGKSTLLRAYQGTARVAEVRAVLVDARGMQPTPSAFAGSLAAAMGCPDEPDPLEALRHGSRGAVLLIDSFEHVAPLEPWLRDTFLPSLPASCLVVLAGRELPSVEWRSDIGWKELLRVIALRNLRPEQSGALLSERGITVERHGELHRITHGHPLALALMADVAAQGNLEPSVSMLTPDIVRTLLDTFVRGVPGPQHRKALQICAHVRATSQAMLREILGDDAGVELYEWLRGLSFVQEGRDGVFPHDLARDVLDLEFLWRDREAYRKLHHEARKPIIRAMALAPPEDRLRRFRDITYLHRRSPVVSRYLTWKESGRVIVEPATPADEGAIVSMVERHESAESARISSFWLSRRPEAFTVFRGDDGFLGFMTELLLDGPDDEEIAMDPCVAAAWPFVQSHGPLRHTEQIYIGRFWMDRDVLQEVSPVHDVICMRSEIEWLTNSRIAWSLVTASRPEYWRPMLDYMRFSLVPEAGFRVGKIEYGVFAYDWRAGPRDQWARAMAEQELNFELSAGLQQGVAVAPLLVLSQPDFEVAVRDALRTLGRPEELAENPMLRSRLTTGSHEATRAERAERLNTLVRRAAEDLRKEPRGDKLYRALDVTYLRPARTQEAAAERLGLPFSTYRRHLTAAVRRVQELLWHYELHGPPADV